MGRGLEIGNPPIPVEMRRSARARRLSLRVSRLDGKVTLTVPSRAPEGQALAFLREREAWLRGHLSDIAEPVRARPGAVIPVEGREVCLAEGSSRRPIRDGDRLLLPRGAGPAAVAGYLKALARDRLAAASDRHAAALGVDYTRLTLRDTRSRWGSCTSAGGLMYSWRLVMAPPAVLDYVAAHEVAHRIEMNHAPAFWALVEGRVPDWQVHRDWLRQNGDRLHAVRFE